MKKKIFLCRTDNQLIAVGSAEGEVVIVNNQSGKIVANFSCKKRQTNEDEEESGSNSVESLIFSTPETNHLLTADVDGNFMGKITKFLPTGCHSCLNIPDHSSPEFI